MSNFSCQIEQLSEDFLRCEQWSFWLRENATFELDSHFILIRKTRRHNFHIQVRWQRLNQRENNLARTEPHQWVKDRCLAIFNEKVKFI